MCGRVVNELILGTETKLDEQMLQYLSPSQINGVRFLYRNYENQKASIISGPNNRFYNEWIILSLIYALATKAPNKNLQCRKSIIVITKSEGKKLVWVNFLQNLLPDACKRTKDGKFFSICVTFQELSEINSELSTSCLIVLDEIKYLDKELDSKIIKNCITKVPCVFSCDSETSLFNDLQKFHKILKNCGQEVSFVDSHEFINTFYGKHKRKKLRAFIKPFYLEILWREVKDENVSEKTKQLNSVILNECNSETTPYDIINTAIFITRISPVEAETCNMSPLQFENKSDDIYNADTQPYISCKGTTQSVYGQELRTWNSEQALKHSEEILKEQSPNTSVDLFKDSMELEDIASSKEVIVISSGSTVAQKSTNSSTINRCISSEDLFSDVDNDDESVLLTQNKPSIQQKSSELDSPIPLSMPSIKALERCNTKISTPIAQLVSSKAFQDSESPIGFLSPNFWSETKKNESVFEITKNDVFSNVLRVNEFNEISPVTERQRSLPKFDWSAFTNPESPSALIESPKRDPETSKMKKLNDSSSTHTPTSKRTTTPSDNASSSKKVFKSEDGWLNKYSPKVVPVTPKNRRKRLEALFNEISTPITDNLGQDMLMSPTDLFE